VVNFGLNIGADKIFERALGGARSPAERRELRVRSERLLEEFRVVAGRGHKWLSPRRLARPIGPDAISDIGRSATAQLLISLPEPGAARASRRPDPNQSPAEERWGPVTVVGQSEALPAFRAVIGRGFRAGRPCIVSLGLPGRIRSLLLASGTFAQIHLRNAQKLSSV
jgi:hypothetical protein